MGNMENARRVYRSLVASELLRGLNASVRRCEHLLPNGRAGGMLLELETDVTGVCPFFIGAKGVEGEIGEFLDAVVQDFEENNVYLDEADIHAAMLAIGSAVDHEAGSTVNEWGAVLAPPIRVADIISMADMLEEKATAILVS